MLHFDPDNVAHITRAALVARHDQPETLRFRQRLAVLLGGELYRRIAEIRIDLADRENNL